jgi:hypothetical protein
VGFDLYGVNRYSRGRVRVRYIWKEVDLAGLGGWELCRIRAEL